MFIDYHVHSSYSDDSEYPMEQIVEDAVEAGIEELCFTDHVDYGIKRDWDDPLGIEYCAGGEGEPETIALANVDYPRYAQEVSYLQSRYEGRIGIKMGMEFGMQQHTIQQYEQLFAKYPFDFILLSVHQVGDKEFWTQEFQEGRTQKEYNERYYEELLYLVRHYQNYSVLGHLDLIARYDKAGVYPFEKISPILTEILKTVIQNGKGIEVNTSCYRYGLHDLTPSRNILRLYRELGGKILTVGSDSHKKEHLGMYIPETLAELKEMGFETICTYHQMNPQFHKL